MSQAQANVDYIKEMMLDPETAHILQEAGVKLNDPPPVVQKKLSDYSYRQDRIDKINEMAGMNI